MARPIVSRAVRARNIMTAYQALEFLIRAAEGTEKQYGESHPATLRAWESVEVHGATIHRQSRLLAGKSKGG